MLKGKKQKRKEPEPENIPIKTVVFILLVVGCFIQSFIPSVVRLSSVPIIYPSIYRSEELVSLSVKDIITYIHHALPIYYYAAVGFRTRKAVISDMIQTSWKWISIEFWCFYGNCESEVIEITLRERKSHVVTFHGTTKFCLWWIWFVYDTKGNHLFPCQYLWNYIFCWKWTNFHGHFQVISIHFEFNFLFIEVRYKLLIL